MIERPPMWEKQRMAYDRVIRRGIRGTGLLISAGCGKTRIMVEAIEHFRANDYGGVNLVLVVANLSGMYVWVENWDKWADYPAIFVDLQKSGSAGLRKAQQLAAEGQLVICIINYEMTWQLGHRYIERIRDAQTVRILEPVDTILTDVEWDLAILDESTYIGNNSSKVSKFIVRKLRAHVKMRFFLTGTGYTKSPLKLYPMLKWLGGDRYVAGTFTMFKGFFTIPHPRIRGAILGFQNLTTLVKQLAKCCVLLRKDEMLDLPPTIDQNYYIELPDKARALYKKVTDEFYAELDEFAAQGGTVTVKHVFAIMHKQLQVAAGHILPDLEAGSDMRPDPVDVHDEKIKCILDILATREGEPTLIVTQTSYMEKRLIAAIQKRFKFTPKLLNGDVKGSEARHKMVADASKDPAFIIKESVGAMALDMQYADMTIWAEHRPNTSNYEQMRARNHRGTQEKTITYVHIIAKKTVDERTMQILNGDLDVAKQIEANWRALIK